MTDASPDSPAPRDTAATPVEERRLGGFFAGTVGRPVMLGVLFLTVVVVGIISYREIPIQMLPSGFTQPSINVWIPNPGASARENEEKVARPVEEQLRTLPGIRLTVSNSRENYVQLNVRFENNADMDLARAEVRDRLERARPNLPETVETPQMWTESADTLPLTFFGISVAGDPSRRDFLMEKHVVPQLEAVDGIGNVDVWGILRDSVRIMIDEDKLAASGIDLGGIIGRLSRDNFAMPMGEITDGGREIILRADMRFDEVEDIAEFPIGGGLRLKDIARVAKVKSVGNMLTLIDGEVAYYGMATKDSQSNVVETSQNLRKTVEAIESDPAVAGAVKVKLFFVQGDFIEGALDQLQETAIWGGALAVVVLFVFLRRLRLTLVVAMSIPASALVAVIWQYFTGNSFNFLTMVGVTLVIGMLVDNSVVLVENITRIHDKGHPPLRAAVLGSRQIALAVCLATLTTVAVFVPIIFMSDSQQARVMIGGMGIPLSISLLASLLVAVIFLPVVTGRLLTGARSRPLAGMALLNRLAVIPVRLVAWAVGGLRLGWYLVRRLVHKLSRLTLAVASPLRWVVAVAALGLAGFKSWSLFQGFQGAEALKGFGIDSSVIVGPMVGTAVLSGMIVAGLAIFGFKRWQARPKLAPARPERFVPEGHSLVKMAVDMNRALVGWTMEHRLAATLLGCLALCSGFLPGSKTMVAAAEAGESDDSIGFRVSFDAPFTLGEAEEQVRIYGDCLEEWREELEIKHWTVRFDERSGNFSLFFDGNRQKKEIEGIKNILERDFPKIPGHRLRMYREDQAAMTNAVAQFILRGPDWGELERIGSEAKQILEKVRGISQVSTPLDSAPDVIEVRVDRDVAHDLGVSSESVQNTIAWSLRGWPLPRYQEEGRDVPLLIELDEDEIAGYGTLRDLSVFSENAFVPLASLSQFNFTKGSYGITRRDGETSFTLEGKVDDPLQVIPVTERAHAALDHIELPRGFSWDRSESALRQTRNDFTELFKALLFGIFLIFVLMAILFESLLLPFSILFTIPFAVVGAFWALLLGDVPLDVVGVIGILILAGIVVNNGIVLIDRVHRLTAVMDRKSAVIQGCGERVRPIMMTAMTTVCGLAPMILSEPSSSNVVDYRSLATIVAGGLIASTFFTLWIVPLTYTLFDDFGQILGQRFRWWLGPRARKGRAGGSLPVDPEPAQAART